MRRQLLKKRNRKPLFIPFVLVLVCSLLQACSDSANTPPAPPSEPEAVQLTPVASSPTVTVEQKIEEPAPPVYSYNPSGRIDPFAPLIQTDTKKAKTGDRPPLERHNISEFKLAGIVWGGFGYNAMLEGPDGKGYFVRVGTILGPNGGIIKKITQNAMIIEEKFKTYTGDTERKEIVVELRKKQEATP